MGAKVIQLTDTHILEGCRKKDRKSQRQLYEKYYQSMSWVCIRYVKNQDLAYDLVHDGFLKIFKRIDQFNGKGSLEGWMKRVMVNLCLDYLRKQKSLPQNVELEEARTRLVDEEVVANMEAELILKVVQELNPLHRTVFNLNVIEGFPHKEIAAMIKVKESTSRAYLTEAKKQIRIRLAHYGIREERRVKNG
ncbi:MAG: sigma-70 family RNA polymerase sigma factor [Bacteroidota bacterium]